MGLRLRIDNPFTNGFIVNYEDGTQVLKSVPVEYPGSESDIRHVVRGWDTAVSLAYEYYKDSKWYWAILHANELSHNWDLMIGQEIIIPDLETFKTLL